MQSQCHPPQKCCASWPEQKVNWEMRQKGTGQVQMGWGGGNAVSLFGNETLSLVTMLILLSSTNSTSLAKWLL